MFNDCYYIFVIVMTLYSAKFVLVYIFVHTVGFCILNLGNYQPLLKDLFLDSFTIRWVF